MSRILYIVQFTLEQCQLKGRQPPCGSNPYINFDSPKT